MQHSRDARTMRFETGKGATRGGERLAWPEPGASWAARSARTGTEDGDFDCSATDPVRVMHAVHGGGAFAYQFGVDTVFVW